MYLSISAGQTKIREIVTQFWESVGKSITNMGVTEVGAYFSPLFAEPSKNSMHEGICPKGYVCKDILSKFMRIFKDGGFMNTNASEFPNTSYSEE